MEIYIKSLILVIIFTLIPIIGSGSTLVVDHPIEPVFTASAIKTEKIVRIEGYDKCNCVSYARWKTGMNVGPIGVAGNHPVNSSKPLIGGYVIFNGYPGHMSVVTALDGDFITIEEANYTPCEYGTRTIDVTQFDIKGYFI